MTSNHALELAQLITRNSIEVSGPLLFLLDAFLRARGDPLAEAMTQDVMKFLYAQTEHCDESMQGFISQQEADQHRLVA